MREGGGDCACSRVESTTVAGNPALGFDQLEQRSDAPLHVEEATTGGGELRCMGSRVVVVASNE